MKILGNIIWFIFGGWLIFIEYLIGGIASCLTIIGIPFGIQIFKLSGLAAFPFGKKVVDKESRSGLLAVVMNIVWILTGGVWAALTHLGLALFFAITIIGLPFAKQHLKLASLALFPFGRDYIN